MIVTHGNCYDFYIPNNLCGYINGIKPFTEVNCELQLKQTINKKTGVNSISVKLLNIDGVLSNEE